VDSSLRKQLVQQAVEHALVREPNDLEWLFREGVLTAGPPYTVRLHTPDAVVSLLGQDNEADAFEALLRDLRQRVGSVRVTTTAEMHEQLLLTLARVATGAALPVGVEWLAKLVAGGESVVSLCEMDGLEWLGEPATLAPGVVLGRVSDSLEEALAGEVAEPGLTLVPDFFHSITEDFQGDRVDPPQPADDYEGHYPVVLCLATSTRSVATNVIVLRRLAAALGGALWLFVADPGHGITRPGIRDYAAALDREYDSQFDLLVWNGGRWDNQPEDSFRNVLAAEPALAGDAGQVFALAARAVSEPRNALAERVFACLRAAASACDQTDPYDRLLLLVVALEALTVRGKSEPVQESFVAQLAKLSESIFDPQDLKHLYDARSSLAHAGLLDYTQESRLSALTGEVAVPCLRAALVKLVQLHDGGINSASELRAWHDTGSM
jgi:Apea-like HEPN